ncbi:MAG: ATP-binding protein, partial [Woeseiaceae bacterium]
MEAINTPDKEMNVRPLHRIQLRAILLVLALVSLTVGSSNWFLVRLIETQLASDLDQTTNRIADALVLRLQTHLDQPGGPDVERVSALLQMASQSDPQLGFLAIIDNDGNPITQIATSKKEPWVEYVNGKRDDVLHNVNFTRPRPVELADGTQARMLRKPVLSFSEDRAMAPRMLGYVVLGVLDPVRQQMVARMRTLMIGVGCVACLIAVPLTVILISRLTRPLRRVVRAMTLLASQDTLPPLPVRRQDEIGVLARAFTTTAEQLSAARARLIQANASLEQQVAQRTKDLSRTQKKLELEIMTKNEFLRTVSHDLNAPLRNIAGMTAMIKRRFENDLPEEVRTRLERISANVELETGMLDDLLEIGRIHARPGEVTDVDLQALVSRIFDALSHEMTEAGITKCIYGPLPIIRVEENRARQLFQNLIDNSIKYMGDQPQRSITIESRVLDDMLEIRVADTGPGIAPEDRDRIFTVFRRGANVDAQTVPGRGVGLASVRAVCEHWGGSI